MIAGGRFPVNNARNFSKVTPKKPGEISKTPNQPDARLIERSESECATVFRETYLINAIVLFYTLIFPPFHFAKPIV